MFLRLIYLSIHILILSNLSCSGGELLYEVPLLPRQEQFTLNIAHLIEYIYSQGYKCTFGETYRTTEMSDMTVTTDSSSSDTSQRIFVVMSNGRTLFDEFEDALKK